MGDRSLRLSRRNLLIGGASAIAAGSTAAVVNAVAPFVLPETPRFDVNHSYWSLALPPPNPPPTHDLRADVIVIGGGFTGLSAAYYVRQALPKAEVVVLEAARCGNGASARNGAMLLTSTEDTYLEPDGDPLLRRRLYALTCDNIDRIRALSVATGVDCELDQRGAVQVAYDEADAQRMPATAARLRAAGLPIEPWTATEVARALGTHAYRAGLYDPNSGQVHPGKMVVLWKQAAERAGARIYEHAAVTAVQEGPRIRLALAGGTTASAPIVILATNAYSSKLGYLRSAVAPIVNHVAITRPLTAEELAAAGWIRRIPFNDSRTNVVYAGLTRDHRLHIGGGIEQYEFNDGLSRPDDHGRGVAFLRRELTRLYPAVAAVPFERTWYGFVDMSLDGSSSVGRTGHHGNLLYAIGFSGQGVNWTSVLGRVLGDVTAERDSQWAWLPYLARRLPYIPNEPFRWLGAEGGIRVISTRT